MSFDPKRVRLKDYGPKEFAIECARCQRRADVTTYKAVRKFGDCTLAEVAILVARSGGCHLAADPTNVVCDARAVEVPVHWWGNLDHARYGGWLGYLTCCRRLAGLKRADACPEVVTLDVLSLCAALGGDFPLLRLPPRMRCPHCGTHSVEIQWFVPEPTDPGGTTEKEPPILQFRKPKGFTRYRVIDGPQTKRLGRR